MNTVYAKVDCTTQVRTEDPESQSEISRIIDELEKMLADARNVGLDLEGRLESILAPVPPVIQTGQMNTVIGYQAMITIQSPLGSRIAAIKRDLGGHCLMLRGLIDRLRV